MRRRILPPGLTWSQPDSGRGKILFLMADGCTGPMAEVCMLPDSGLALSRVNLHRPPIYIRSATAGSREQAMHWIEGWAIGQGDRLLAPVPTDPEWVRDRRFRPTEAQVRAENRRRR